jgi:hypothetical protein
MEIGKKVYSSTSTSDSTKAEGGNSNSNDSVIDADFSETK